MQSTSETDRSDDGAADTAPRPSYVRDAAPVRLPLIGLAALVATARVTVSGVLAVSLALFERLETWLVRHGVDRPRHVMAVIAAVGSLVLDQVAGSKDSKGASQ
ncbi:hypothetical protein OL239_11490 [Arthrobacter sp. ATA002]|uniref:hypothetical protein n=1 Tax=Arthrobacter sp. ATA002 TaxID=2991715 RepID=UPI0022A78C58|nr:hypothetical protein [Arthrobacter sp. ATA002]WAP50648.1 hypothetical protein OL239_11490 [Arthrobacter sp. ATA002]